MDYYLIQERVTLAEEFSRRNDFSTAGLRSSDAGLSRLIRTDPSVSVVAIAHTAQPPPLRDYEEFPASPPLVLSPTMPEAGFREKRLYRVLFARTPTVHAYQGKIAVEMDLYTWRLRRIGNGVAWCVDVIADLNGDTTLGPVLDRITQVWRMEHGLIPVTTERLH